MIRVTNCISPYGDVTFLVKHLFQIKMEIKGGFNIDQTDCENEEQENIRNKLKSQAVSEYEEDFHLEDSDLEDDSHEEKPLKQKVKLEDKPEKLEKKQDWGVQETNSKTAIDMKKFEGSQACFGSGTFLSPLVKFYFTAPCPQLGIEAGAEPMLGGRPAFTASLLGFTCR